MESNINLSKESNNKCYGCLSFIFRLFSPLAKHWHLDVSQPSTHSTVDTLNSCPAKICSLFHANRINTLKTCSIKNDTYAGTYVTTLKDTTDIHYFQGKHENYSLPPNPTKDYMDDAYGLKKNCSESKPACMIKVAHAH